MEIHQNLSEALGDIASSIQTVRKWVVIIRKRREDNDDQPRSGGYIKVMHIIFFDVHVVILSWPVPSGTTVNGLYYLWVLREKLRPVIRKKGRNRYKKV